MSRCNGMADSMARSSLSVYPEAVGERERETETERKKSVSV